MELPKYDLVLCKLNEEPLMTLQNIDNLSYKGEFTNIDELSFQVPLHRTESDGDLVENERYHSVKGDMLILLNNTKYFYIHYAKESVNKDGSVYKEIQAYSREYELSQKRVVDYSGVSRKLYDTLNSKDENGLETGILNYVEKICSWKVGYIKSSLLDKFRELNFPNSNLLEVFQELQQTYGCLFQFNTFDKIIDVYEADQLGVNQGLIISDRNFLQELNKDIKSDAIKTRLYLYGMDNVSIQKLNITGQPYIENYDFYKNTDYMSQGLIDALNNYDAFVATKENLFNGYLNSINTKNSLIGVKNDELIELQSQLKVIQSNLDIAISSEQPSGSLKTQETGKLGEISSKLEEIILLQSEIEAIEGDIQDIAISTSMDNYFTEAQARELDSFIREDTFQDGNYTEENIDELLEEGRKILSRISQPAIQFSCSVVDFLSSVECQHSWDKFVLGDKVNLYHRDLNFDYEERFVGYTHNTSGNSLDMRFSNTNSIDDANLYLRDLLADLKTTSTNVDFSKYKWDKGEQANSTISKYIDSNLDLSKQAILTADGQKPIMDERGHWIVKQNPDGTVDPKQMRIINNVLAITNDNWNTVDTAITGDGINANVIRGKLGQFATINAEQIIVGDSEIKLPEYIDEFGNSITVHQIILSSDSQVIPTDKDGKTLFDVVIEVKLDVLKGVSKIDAILSNPVLKNSNNQTITSGVLSKRDPTPLSNGLIKWTIPNGTNVPSDIGYITVSITAEGKIYEKRLAWAKAKAGVNGINGINGLDGLQGDNGNDGIDGVNGINGISSYTHIAYANNSSGTDGFSTSDSLNKTYVGMYVDEIKADSTTPSKYKWTLIKGADGSKGIAGTNGADGQTPYLHIAYATNSTGTTGFSTTISIGKTYIGQYTDFIEDDSETASKYKWTLIKGSDGYSPVKGTDYFDGIDGQDGVSSYLWVKYSASADGTGFNDTPNTYIGVATTSTSTAPTLKTAYKWSKAVGADGVRGEDGANGKTSYLHIKYSDNGTSFTANNGETIGKWIGTYVDFIEADSTSFSKYTWNKVVGNDGSNGINGQGVTSITEEFYLSTSKSYQSGGSWSSSPPTWINGRYMWVRTKVVYNNPTSTVYTTPLCDGAWEAINGIQNQINTAVKLDYQYNKTKISIAEGIEVFDAYNTRRIQIGGIDTTGNGVKNNYGVRASHSDGSFSALVPEGFIKKYAYGEGRYLNDIWVSTILQHSGNSYETEPPRVRVYLPKSFRGRESSTKIVLMLSGLSSTQLSYTDRLNSTNLKVEWVATWFEIVLNIGSKNFNVTTPYIDVDAYSYVSAPLANGTSKSRINDYRVASFTVLVIGT